MPPDGAQWDCRGAASWRTDAARGAHSAHSARRRGAHSSHSGASSRRLVSLRASAPSDCQIQGFSDKLTNCPWPFGGSWGSVPGEMRPDPRKKIKVGRDLPGGLGLGVAPAGGNCQTVRFRGGSDKLTGADGRRLVASRRRLARSAHANAIMPKWSRSRPLRRCALVANGFAVVGSPPLRSCSLVLAV